MIIRPENFKPLGVLGNIFRFAFFHTKRDTNYPLLIIETHDEVRAIEDLKKYIVEWGINKIWDLDTVEVGEIGVCEAFIVNTRRNQGEMFKPIKDELYSEETYIFQLKEKSVVNYCDIPF